jgi:pimeloyl-ACP methyl ester carboxylesterase
MIARLFLAYFLLAVFPASPGASAHGAADRWTDKEMGRSPGGPKGIALRAPLPAAGRPENALCKGESSKCTFQLTYFLGDGFDLARKQRLNILFIPGGPGAIVDTGNRAVVLQELERRHNVVYFHPRGMGRSVIDGGKEYDRFLRADYVVEDIERLRQEVLKTRPWDAIYAHSWGTVVAQRYAARFGRPKGAPPKVMSLVLSGPVDRHRADTQGARSRMIVENLKMIFDYYRSPAAAHCQCESSTFLRTLVTDFSTPQISPRDNRLEPTDNFCFMKSDVADNVLKRLEKVISEIDENYGSADLIVDNFDRLEQDKEFNQRFQKLPVEFFAAVRYLQMSGAPVNDGLVFVADSRNRINAALLIAHYLTAADGNRCSPKEVLFQAAAAECDYCARLKVAIQEQRASIGGRGESLRASYVFGIYDGVTRWAPQMMGEKGCFSGRDLAKFADGSGSDKRFGRDQVTRVGIVAEEKICPWNPADYRHEVPALLLKGSRDAVVAGCQAEDFYQNGVGKGRAVLLEFRGLGHDLSVGNLSFGAEASIWSKRFAGLLEDFVKMSSSPEKFRSSAEIKEKLRQLKVSDRSGEAKLTASCAKNS